MSQHPVAEIKKNSLSFNLEVLKNFLFPHQKIAAVVKANAYGLGAREIANLLEEKGIDFFCVSSIEEAIEIREAGIKGSILTLAPFVSEKEIEQYFDYQVIPTLVDYSRAKTLDRIAKQKNQKIPAHFKIDTGMGRLGPRFDTAEKEIIQIKNLSNIDLQGIFSHFASADTLDRFSSEQTTLFKKVVKNLEAQSIFFAYKHIANSSGLVGYNDPFFNLVRPGILLYGAYPSDAIRNLVEIEPVVSLKAKLLYQKTLKEGDSVSYNRTFTLKEPRKIGVFGIGYADGYSTLHSNKGYLYIQEKKCPIIGRVCMDYVMADITNISAKIGEEALLYGDKEGIRIEEIAKERGIIPYEVLTSLSPRVKRKYI